MANDPGDSIILRILRPFSRFTQASVALPTWVTLEWGAGLTLTDDPTNKRLVASVNPGAAGYVPDTRTISASLPIRIDGGASADLSADRTISCNSANGSNPGSMSSAHYTLLTNATASPTANTLCLRGGAGEVRGVYFATAASNVAAAGAVRCVAGDQMLLALKGATAPTVGILSISGTGSVLQVGDGNEITDVRTDFYGGTYTLHDANAGLVMLTVDAASGSIVFTPGPSSIATTINDTGIALGGASVVAESNGSQDFALWCCANGSTTPTVPLITWTKGSSTATFGGHAASTTVNTELDANTNVKIKVGGTTAFESTSNRLNIYGVTPIGQASRVGQLTNSTGGTPSTTLAAIAAGALYAQADMVAVKNALASLATTINAIEGRISAAAGGFAITA